MRNAISKLPDWQIGEKPSDDIVYRVHFVEFALAN